MGKVFQVLLGLFIFAIIFVSPALAKVNAVAQSASPSGEIDVFKLFWPISPGKTLDEPMYFLKDLKEKIRGVLIFSPAAKAEYAVLLATKRVLESEKLVNQGKNDLANKTLDLAKNQFEMAEKNLEMAKSKKESLKESGAVTFARLSNLETFLTHWISKDSVNKDKLQQILTQITFLKDKIR